MSDEDIVLDDGSMEPESPTGEAPAQSFDDGDDSVEEVISSRSRGVSEKTRALFAKAAADLKRQAQELANEGETGEYDEGYTPPADRPGPAAAAAPPPAPSPAVADSATAPLTPLLDPEIADLKQRLSAMQDELAERERKVAERESTGDFAKFRDAYTERGHGALVELIKSWSETMTDDELQTEVADLVTGLSADILKVPVPSDIRAQIEARRAMKTVKAHTARLAQREKEIDARRAAAEDAATEQRAIAALQAELASEAHRKAFPFLAEESDAAAIVFDVIKKQHRRDGTMMQWTEAAKRANQILDKRWRAEIAKRQHILTSSQANAEAVANARTEQPQGGQQTRPRSLTNAQASTAPTPPPNVRNDADEKWAPERHRAETKRRFRAAFQRTEE